MSMPTLLPQVIGLMHCMYVLCGVRGKTVAPAAGRVRVPQLGTPQAGGTLVPRGQKGAVLLPAASPAGATGPAQELLEGQSVGDTDPTAQAHSGIWSGCYCSCQIWTCDFAY